MYLKMRNKKRTLQKPNNKSYNQPDRVKKTRGSRMEFATLLNKRDSKAKPHLEQYSPVWLTSEIPITQDEAIQFSVAFQHKDYGWVNRRYRYDGFNDVLYYRGQVVLSENEALDIQEKTPYIPTLIADEPNSYGG
jgi:hypothetical protein